jgi:hypothetical protein
MCPDFLLNFSIFSFRLLHIKTELEWHFTLKL